HHATDREGRAQIDHEGRRLSRRGRAYRTCRGPVPAPSLVRRAGWQDERVATVGRAGALGSELSVRDQWLGTVGGRGDRDQLAAGGPELQLGHRERVAPVDRVHADKARREVRAVGGAGARLERIRIDAAAQDALLLPGTATGVELPRVRGPVLAIDRIVERVIVVVV